MMSVGDCEATTRVFPPARRPNRRKRVERNRRTHTSTTTPLPSRTVTARVLRNSHTQITCYARL